MSRGDLERLSREESIELVQRLQRLEKTSRTASKPPATDRKERREQSKPGGAKPGHEGHSRVLSDDPDTVVEHRPDRCTCCGGILHGDLPTELVSLSEQIDVPQVAPVVTQHRRLAVHCPSCGTRVVAPVPEIARGGAPRILRLIRPRPPCPPTRVGREMLGISKRGNRYLASNSSMGQGLRCLI